ncbi:GntR family transcriptional regulator [Streptomyces murinus]|uniref:GntR family transcriptional regulator n=1 Tax=Streptomyces murinus TaxID=33900 RepID=UPI003804843D
MSDPRDRDRGHPYERVAAVIRDRIASGAWPPGYRLPSRHALAHELLDGAGGENVVRRAQEMLIEEGVLEARKGSGTYVRAPRSRYVLRAPLCGLLPDGFNGRWETHSTPRIAAPDPIADRLGIETGALCVRTEYTVHAAGEGPLLAVTSWEPMELTGSSPVVLPGHGPLADSTVAERMAQADVRVIAVKETLTPVVLDRVQAPRVSAPVGSMAIVIARTHVADDGRVVETADLLVPALHWELAYQHQLASGRRGIGGEPWAVGDEPR